MIRNAAAGAAVRASQMAENETPVVAYVGLGSNLGDSVATLSAAATALAALPRTRMLRNASLYKSAPIGAGNINIGEQPDFINGVCALTTTLGEQDLLQHLMTIEQEFGRHRTGELGQPRTLDLDLLLYGDLSDDSDKLTLPHPRLHERAFVLYPLNEIAPDLVIPGQGRVSDLLQNCLDQRIERLPAEECEG